MLELLTTYWLAAVIFLAVGTSVFASANVVLRKRDVRSAIGWVGLIWLVPIAGAALYGLFGINRIRRRASELGLRQMRLDRRGDGAEDARPALASSLPNSGRHLSAIGELIDSLSPVPLTHGNAVEMLVGGEVAYGRMIEAIDAASSSIGMATYIFDNDRAGRMFAEALKRAHDRGVKVRLLIDAVGARYSYPTATSRLRRLGIPLAEFLPTFVPLHMHYSNLRNHRKIMIVDGKVGFTGGMNIRKGYLKKVNHNQAVNDTHFQLQGPVVAHLAETFASDWAFCTGEKLRGDVWFPDLSTVGGAFARGIAAGPDEDLEKIRWAILGALSQAKERIRIVTPYFLPDQMLITALVLAAMRGVNIEILLPEFNNLRLVQWASRAKIGELLTRGCRVWQTPAPFDHSKLMTIDGAWSLIGSANWDQRSLRLNFEFDVECYDTDLARVIDDLIEAKRGPSRPLTLEAINGRNLATKLRDGSAWLLSPYL
jgi:cardiolipin synthase